MNATESVSHIAQALAAAQRAFRTIERTREAKIASQKGSYVYTYATLADVYDVVREPLAENGLAIVQTTATNERGNLELETTLLHTSGERISTMLPVQQQGAGPQALGSALTYARRYAIVGLLGLATDDDDGAAATKRPRPPSAGDPPRTEHRQERTAPPAPSSQTRMREPGEEDGPGPRDDFGGFAPALAGANTADEVARIAAEAKSVLDADTYQRLRPEIVARHNALRGVS